MHARMKHAHRLLSAQHSNFVTPHPHPPTGPQFIQDEGMVTTLQRKLAPPLVTLLGAEPELQYVVRARGAQLTDSWRVQR